MQQQPQYCNRQLWQKRLQHAYQQQKSDFFLHHDAANIANERLFDVKQELKTLFYLSLQHKSSTEAFPPYIQSIHRYSPIKNTQYDFFDEELQHHPRQYDIISSILCLHRTNDTVGALIQYKKALKKGGLFHSIMIGEDTLHEWKTALMQADQQLYGGAFLRMLPFVQVKTMGGLLQRAGFSNIIADKVTRHITYNDPMRFLRDMQLMAAKPFFAKPENNLMHKNLIIRALQNMMQHDNRVSITVDYILLHGWHNG